MEEEIERGGSFPAIASFIIVLRRRGTCDTRAILLKIVKIEQFKCDTGSDSDVLED